MVAYTRSTGKESRGEMPKKQEDLTDLPLFLA